MDTYGNQRAAVETPRRKRVLFVITQSEMGGAQQFLAQLLNHLDTGKFECSVVAGEGNNALKELLPSSVAYTAAKHLKRNPNVLSDMQSVLELRRIFKEQRPDIIFLNSSKAGFNGSIAAMGLDIRVIYRIGGWTFNDPWPFWKKKLFTLLEKMSARWKDDIVVNSRKDLLDAQRLNIRPRKQLISIANGIDPYAEMLSPEQARLELQSHIARRASFKEGLKIVGTIANLYPAKGLEDLISAMQSLPEDIASVIIGNGALRPMLEERIRASGLEQRVFLLGAIDKASKLIPGFDVFVLPSWKEGFPWAVLEAMAARVPVVATSVGAVPEILEDGRNGRVVPPQRPDLIAGAISDILSNERDAQEMAIQAHQTLLKAFSVYEMIKRYEELFRS